MGSEVDTSLLQKTESEPHDLWVLLGDQVHDQIEAVCVHIDEKGRRFLQMDRGAHVAVQFAHQHRRFIGILHEDHEPA